MLCTLENNLGAYDDAIRDASGVDGIRWYELRDPNGTPTVFQQATYAPSDGLYRWMGSMAMDRAGDIAVMARL